MSASTGTLVAAGMESAGYVAQSMVLADFSELLIGLAVLIFVILSSKALYSVVADGNYLQALKLLFYPILVVTCLYTTTQSGGSEWQFGTLKGDQAKLKTFVDGNVNAQVSLPFELFNRFVSGMSQIGVGLILDNPVSETVLFTVRQQLLDSILNVDIVSPGLRSLVHEGLQGKCGTWMDATRKIARGNRDPLYQGTPDYNNAIKIFNSGGEPTTRLQTTGPGYLYVQDLLKAMSSGGTAETEAAQLVRSMCENTARVVPKEGETVQSVIDAGISCSQLWCWSGMGLVLEAKAALEEAVAATVESNETYRSLAPESRAYLLQQILEDIAKKVSPDPESDNAYDADPANLPVVIAGFLLRKELNKGPRNLYSEFAETSGVGLSAYQPKVGMTSDDKALLRDHQAEYSLTVAAANQTMAMAYALPYLQGIILFALSLLFPFFVITTAVMRQGGGLLFWAGAWVWAKSWDLGWAVIMLIDQLLWELMPHRSIYVPVSQGMHSPITVMESAFDTDPTYSLATYYLLISMLILSIPTVMGQLFLRSAQSMSQILIGATQQYAGEPAAQLENKKQAYAVAGQDANGRSVTTIEGRAYNYHRLGAPASTMTRSPAVLPNQNDIEPPITGNQTPQVDPLLNGGNNPTTNSAANTPRLQNGNTTPQPQIDYGGTGRDLMVP